MSEKEAQIERTRKQLNSFNFDATAYLGSQISSISIDAADPEDKLFALFDELTNNLTELSQDIEDDVLQLQEYAHHTESLLLLELESHAEKLDQVGEAVDNVKVNFDKASEGAVRVGTRLSTSEKERQQIETSVVLLGFIKAFENAPDNLYEDVKSMNSKQLKESLPVGMKNESWGTISKILHDLRKILFEINSEDVMQAQKRIIDIADVVEAELLGEFDIAINRLMEKPNHAELIKSTRQIAEWLHLFNHGQSLQKRYIFSVVQRRIPSDAFFTGGDSKGTVLNRLTGAIKGVMHRDTDGSDSDSSGGASVDDDEEDEVDQNFRSHSPNGASPLLFNLNLGLNMISGQNSGPTVNGGAGTLMDHLSGLFTMINNVCQEQFALIRKVFPPHTIARVTRLLIQRIFSDPAFGIQARVDGILCPAPPSQPLPLSDYLDALVTVREKLSALYLLLIDYCSHPSLRGMGSESASLKRSKLPGLPAFESRSRRKSVAGDAESQANADSGENYSEYRRLVEGGVDSEDETEERLHSDQEIREFFEDQISSVLSGYVSDYFEKELTHSRNQYVDCLRRAVDDSSSLSKVSAGSILQLPFLRAEKLKSIASIVKTVANRKFLNDIFNITSDAVQRMESIGRDDKKLPSKAKELFLLQLGFLCEGLFLPWSRACTTMLLKLASSRAQNSTLPPLDLLDALAALSYGVNRVKTHFDEVFSRPLGTVPNIVSYCKDSRRNSIRAVEAAAKESLHAWTLCIAVHLEKILLNLQSKYDYSPKFDPVINGLAFRAGSKQVVADPTTACDSVCKALIIVTNAVRSSQTNLIGIDLTKLFWKPLGQQIIGALISHFRKLKISAEGSKVLARDLDEYTHIMALMESPVTMDMMICLAQICKVYAAADQDVAKMVIEDLRFLDTSVVLALLRARPDSTARGPSDHWTKRVSHTYLNQKWEAPLPWESKKHLTVMAFAESVAGGNSNSLGPSTLRKSSAPITALFMSEVARSSLPITTTSNGSARGKTTSVDVTQLDNGFQSLDPRSERHSIASSNGSSRPLSQYLPSRPDDVVSVDRSKSTDGSGSSILSSLSQGVTNNISRPDLIGAKPKLNGSNGSSKQNPYTGTVKGSTATLISGVNRRPSESMRPPQPTLSRPEGVSSTNPQGVASGQQQTISSPSSSTNLKWSMSNLFGGGKKQ